MEGARDVHATLAEMERTLRELSSELARATGEAEPTAAGERGPGPASPSPASPAQPSAGERGPAPTAPLADARRALDALEAALAEGRPPDEALLTAGPFADVDALGRFEAALRGLAGVEDVSLRGFEGDRALLEVRLAAAHR